ncbi:DUF1315 family protein [Natronospirillum operosum]|uniref:DUF1315 family protein n=1 Tax=Natronospirillum operosum TaxID=2759953 RepID=A0A4Z0WKH1_9GAMM|nr:DUF1315 family protein [Natronospirillum operosum]TGG95725.1 DUF1315 family protein [Natronospirillum operosum]
MTSFAEAATQLPREIIDRMREALALGHWPDGQVLTPEQQQTTMETVLTWEAAHLPPEQRTGYIDRSSCGSGAAEIPAVKRYEH